jgi:site-specific recombinase XerD
MNLKGFLMHLTSRGYAPGTITSYDCELRKFQRFLTERKLRVNQVKPRSIEQYLRWRDVDLEDKPATTRRRLAVLASFYNFLVVMSDGHLRDPVRPVRRPRKQPPRPNPLDERQISTLLEGVPHLRDAAILRLFLHSGLRLSELCGLNRDSIQITQIDSGTLGLGRVMGKGGREREFLVDLPSLKIISEYLAQRGADEMEALFLSNRQRRMSQRAMQHMLSAWAEKLGLPPLHPHQLRSTFATRLHRVGVPTLEISKLLGHSSLDTTTRYIKPDARRIRMEYFAAFEKLDS